MKISLTFEQGIQGHPVASAKWTRRTFIQTLYTYCSSNCNL